MATRRPATLDALAGITGVGAVKLERFGRDFLARPDRRRPRTPVHPARRRLAGAAGGRDLFDRLHAAQSALARGADGLAKYLDCPPATLAPHRRGPPRRPRRRSPRVPAWTRSADRPLRRRLPRRAARRRIDRRRRPPRINLHESIQIHGVTRNCTRATRVTPLSADPLGLRDALQRQERGQVGAGDAAPPPPPPAPAWRGRPPRARPPRTMSASFAPSPTASTASGADRRPRSRPPASAASLAARPRIGRATSPVSRPSRTTSAFAWCRAKPAAAATRSVKKAEAARDQRRLRPERRHGPRPAPAPPGSAAPARRSSARAPPPAAPAAARPARAAPPRSRARPASPPR